MIGTHLQHHPCRFARFVGIVDQAGRLDLYTWSIETVAMAARHFQPVATRTDARAWHETPIDCLSQCNVGIGGATAVAHGSQSRVQQVVGMHRGPNRE